MHPLLQPLERKIRDFRDHYLRRYRHESLPKEIYSKALNKYSISFCTTCMNRFFHLQKTFLKNIHDNEKYPHVEFVLVNYNSQDGLHTWAQKTLPPYIEKGIVNYYHTTTPEHFHASIAKNLAHKVANGKIVCNLDADNFTGKDFAFYLNYKMQALGESALLHVKKAPYWGTEGRIVLMKKDFMTLGGYDESFGPIGHQDHDLIDRAKAYGLQYENIQIENFLHYLSNTTIEKSNNCSEEYVNYYDFCDDNRKRSHENLARNILHANPDGWGSTPLYKNFSNEIFEPVPIPSY
jgi:hypothetical protein